MKKIRLFSTKAIKGIEGAEAELYVNFYLVLNRNYIFTFLIDAPNLSCSDRHPIKLWKHFLIMYEEEYVKYMRRYETIMHKERDASETAYRKGYQDALQNKACWQKVREKNEVNEVLDKIRAEIEQIEINGYIRDVECFNAGINTVLKIIDKYRSESEDK